MKKVFLVTLANGTFEVHSSLKSINLRHPDTDIGYLKDVFKAHDSATFKTFKASRVELVSSRNRRRQKTDVAE